MGWIETIDSWVLALVALALQVVASEIGWRVGLRRTDVEVAQRFQAGAVQSAVLAMLGLLLAFSFSMGAVRYEERRDLVVEESNAIGTAYLRAGMLPPAERDELRAILRDYVDARLAFFDAETPEDLAEAIRASEVLLGRLWKKVAAHAADAPGHHPGSLLAESVGEVVDLHAERVAANDARIPPRILALLTIVAVAGLGTVGWCFGLARGPHRGPCLLLAAVVSAILLVVVDLDEPQGGKIRVPAETMRHLQREMTGE